jgi:hypothetical protein
VVLPQFPQKGPSKLSIWLILSQFPAQLENKAARKNGTKRREDQKRKERKREEKEQVRGDQ